MGCQPLLIADRLGHEKIQTTLNTYSHLYPNKQAEVAAQLENVMNGTTVPNGSQNGRCSQFVANKREKSLESLQNKASQRCGVYSNSFADCVS